MKKLINAACQKKRKARGPSFANPGKIFWLLLASLINRKQTDCGTNMKIYSKNFRKPKRIQKISKILS